jgi:hypothetical protein
MKGFMQTIIYFKNYFLIKFNENFYLRFMKRKIEFTKIIEELKN